MIIEPLEISTTVPHVWVVQEVNNDYTPAENFGLVKFITRSDLRTMRGSQQTETVNFDIRKFLADYVQGHDYIVPAGNPMVLALLCLALPPGDHKFLKWDGRQNLYIPFTLSSKMIKQPN